MKSIANQYRDLKEGKMSQSNFMRNLRMSMPQYITNVTSFNDAVKILKNKAILTESDLSRDAELNKVEDDFKQLLAKGYSYSEALELIAQNTGMDPDELESMLPQDAVDTEEYENLNEEEDPNFRDAEHVAKVVAQKYGDELVLLYKARRDDSNSSKQYQNEAINYAGQEMLAAGMKKVAIRNLLSGYGYFEDWIMEYFDSLSKELEKYEPKVDSDDEAELDNMIDKMNSEDELSPEKYKFQDFEGGLSEDKYDDEINQAFLTFLKNIYAKSPTEKIAQMIADQEAKMGISKKEIPGFEGTRDALDNLSIREALNKDIKQFGADLGKYLTNAGFKVKYVNGRASDADRTQVRTNMGLIALEADQNPSQQSLYLYSNPKEFEKIKKVVDKFQLTPYSGRVLSRGWTSKQVQGALNPGDIYKFEDKANGAFYFYRVAQVDTKVKDYTPKESLAETKKKKEAKSELHPNQIHPGELRMGIRVELEHTDDLDKAKKIALDHLKENPFYYTALKLSGIESPSAPKVKAPKDAPKKAKKKDATELVDKANQMQKVKIKEVRLNINSEPNAVVKQVEDFIVSADNPILDTLSDEIELQQTSDPNQAILRYDYWKPLPKEGIDVLKNKFNVEEDGDYDEDTGDITFYRLTPKSSLSEYSSIMPKLEALIREVIAETFDGRDNLVNITDDTE